MAWAVITPDTPLEDLERFFKTSGSEFALVTDVERKFVLGICTVEDLDKCVSSVPSSPHLQAHRLVETRALTCPVGLPLSRFVARRDPNAKSRP